MFVEDGEVDGVTHVRGSRGEQGVLWKAGGPRGEQGPREGISVERKLSLWKVLGCL